MVEQSKEPVPTIEHLDARACAYQQTIAFMRQRYPNMALCSYYHEKEDYSGQPMLLKFEAGIGQQPLWANYDNCDEDTTADNIVGGPAGAPGRGSPVAGTESFQHPDKPLPLCGEHLDQVLWIEVARSAGPE